MLISLVHRFFCATRPEYPISFIRRRIVAQESFISSWFSNSAFINRDDFFRLLLNVLCIRSSTLFVVALFLPQSRKDLTVLYILYFLIMDWIFVPGILMYFAISPNESPFQCRSTTKFRKCSEYSLRLGAMISLVWRSSNHFERQDNESKYTVVKN
jgi:hypothetical protein